MWGRRLSRIARQHYMLAVTALALAAAAAGAIGAFESEEATSAQVVNPARTPPAATAVSQAKPPSMTITYVLVSSEDERFAWDGYEDSMKQRGFLTRYAVEVLVIANQEQATAASQLIDEQQARNPWNTYVVDDRR
jgi:hypothetical protein